MFPHGSVEESTGSPRWRVHTDAPAKRSSEYTVLFSVATITWPSTIRGEANRSASTPAFHATRAAVRGGVAGLPPGRAAVPGGRGPSGGGAGGWRGIAAGAG